MTDWQELVNRFVQEADHLLIVSHIHPDGDAISSTLATGQLLRALGKQVTMVNESPIPKKFSFLPGVGGILQPDQVTKKFKYIVALDCADAERIGTCRQLFAEDAQILNIDHHVTNDHYGQLNVVLPDAAATAEILFQWIEGTEVMWDETLASAIYTGLLTDTGGFRYSNTTPRVLRQAAQLIEAGAPADSIADAALETITMEQLQLLQTALGSLQRSEDGLIAWMSLHSKDLNQHQTSNEDLDGIVNYARNLMGVDVGMLFRETEEQTVKVSFRSRSIVNVGSIAKSLGGGGHARAAGCTFHGTLAEAQAEIIPRIQAELERDKE